MLNFDNTYNKLPSQFFKKSKAASSLNPQLVAWNDNLFQTLSASNKNLPLKDILSYFSGQSLIPGSEPVATVYAGHQFGHFNPQLGDGRALLLGEVLANDHRRYDLQLKGSGPTFYSRGGDGLSPLGPVLREYLVSEAMFYMGVPTTRSLCAVTTGQTVYREQPLPGAILTRVASSHIRVGSFEFFAAQGDVDNLQTLADYTIKRHFPEIKKSNELLYWQLFLAIAQLQIQLVPKWLGLGFIHGVMNTDNTSICGETIDYGPCAFMDSYKSNQVFSFIDQQGRYAYNQQLNIVLWNLSCLANALFPLFLTECGHKAECIKKLESQFEVFSAQLEQEYLQVMCQKMGIFKAQPQDKKIVDEFLLILEKENQDFTNSFRELSYGKVKEGDFEKKWLNRLGQQQESLEESKKLMQSCNPYLIPRNHLIQKSIEQSLAGDYTFFHLLNQAWQKPYEQNFKYKDLSLPPEKHEEIKNTFCGT